uniref:meteorin-like protein isoform X5 n=1 Tax=Monopterus albus TaxID=43700 RepID=UPI0009B45D55|nr:meteorin-like protein isoform X5 [Monopterus albus]
MWPNLITLMCFVLLHLRHLAADLCNWTGSGFAAGVDSRIVLQVRLRCTEGSVRWVYPGQALRVVLEPNLSSAPRTTVCIKPSPSLRGASVFIERAGELQLLVTHDWRPQQVFCFRASGPRRPAIYLQASPQTDGHWNRRTVGFRYELVGNRSAAANLGHSHLQASCRPCSDTELLMAICSSDFDITGGGDSGEGVLAAQWSVRATGGAVSVHLLLAGTHPHSPAVPCEAWGRRVSFHRVRTLWGSLVRVCPAIQRLPVCLPDCPGSTSEFL